MLGEVSDYRDIDLILVLVLKCCIALTAFFDWSNISDLFHKKHEKFLWWSFGYFLCFYWLSLVITFLGVVY